MVLALCLKEKKATGPSSSTEVRAGKMIGLESEVMLGGRPVVHSHLCLQIMFPERYIAKVVCEIIAPRILLDGIFPKSRNYLTIIGIVDFVLKKHGNERMRMSRRIMVTVNGNLGSSSVQRHREET